MPEDHEVIEIPIDGVLDLHTFRPNEIGSLIPEYIGACREKGILNVRIIHGKGKGVLRKGVHSILSRMREVKDFRLAEGDAGGWGATLVTLRPSGKVPGARGGSRTRTEPSSEGF